MTDKTEAAALPSIFQRYWKAYGGIRALFKSGYLWFALITSAILYPLWSVPGWWDTPLSVLPNLLGFSLGGFALWLAIGDDGFRKVITEKEGDDCSAYMNINASFVHFILIQIIAVVVALVAKSFNFSLPADFWVIRKYADSFYFLCSVGSYLGFSVFIYALYSALAATMGLFRITYMYEFYLNIERKKSDARKDEMSNK